MKGMREMGGRRMSLTKEVTTVVKAAARLGGWGLVGEFWGGGGWGNRGGERGKERVHETDGNFEHIIP